MTTHIDEIKDILNALVPNTDVETEDERGTVGDVLGSNTNKILIKRAEGDTNAYVRRRSYRLILKAATQDALDALEDAVQSVDTRAISTTAYKHTKSSLRHYIDINQIFNYEYDEVNLAISAGQDDQRIYTNFGVLKYLSLMNFDMSEVDPTWTLTAAYLLVTADGDKSPSVGDYAFLYFFDQSNPDISAITAFADLYNASAYSDSGEGITEWTDGVEYELDISNAGALTDFDLSLAYHAIMLGALNDAIDSADYRGTKTPRLALYYTVPADYPINISIGNILPMQQISLQREIKLTGEWV